MSSPEVRITSTSREVGASAARVFEAIADPTRQPEWDGNDNLSHAADGQRVRGVGDVFTMTLLRGMVRENHVVEFEEGRRIAWKPAEPGQPPVGHLWRWEIEPIDDDRCRVTHTYDWTELFDDTRLSRARATTSERLASSVDRLAVLVEQELPRQAVRLADKLATFTEHWSPRTVALFNGHDVMVVKVKGEFVWHRHHDTDDFFLVLSGRLTIRMRDGDVVLNPGDLFVVPVGVEHQPFAEEEAHLLLIEPSGTPNTGNADTAAARTII